MKKLSYSYIITSTVSACVALSFAVLAAPVYAQTAVVTNSTVTYTCESGYVLSGSQCTLTTTISATTKTSCPTGYVKIGTTCRNAKGTTNLVTAYSCTSGYALNSNNTCTSSSVIIPATATYSCPTGSILNVNAKTCSQTASTATDIVQTEVVTATVVTSTNSSDPTILSQVQPEKWAKTFPEIIVTRSSLPVAAFLVNSAIDTKGYYLGTFPSKTSQVSGGAVVTATSSIPGNKTLVVPNGTYYVKIVTQPAGSKAIKSLIGKVNIPSSNSIAVSTSTVTLVLPPPYIIITSPVSTDSWKKNSIHNITWVTDFKRSDTPNTNYAGIALAMPYGYGPKNPAPTQKSSSLTTVASFATGMPIASGFSFINTLANPTPVGILTASPMFGVPSMADTMGMAIGVPFAGEIINSLFGDDKPQQVPVTVRAVAYDASSSNHYGKAVVIAQTTYLESARAPIIMRVPAGQYVITISTPKIPNTTTHVSESIVGTSSVITVK